MASSKNERKRSRGNGPAQGTRSDPRREAAAVPRPGLVDAVRDVVAPAVEGTGLWLEEVTMTRAGARSVVRVTVDLPETEVGSLGSDALGEVSRAISTALDADDVVPGVYVLEVSTPGTSRPLTQPRHFRRARTRLVTLVLVDGGEVSGRLEDLVDEDGRAVVVLEDGVRVPLADVRRGRVEVELRRLEEADFGPEVGVAGDGEQTDADGEETDADGEQTDAEDVDDDDAGAPRTREG